MEHDQPPAQLFYTTVEFEDGDIESPHYLIFDSLPEGILTAKEHFRDIERPIVRFVMKELQFAGTKAMSDETQILVPLNDKGVEDEFKDPVVQQTMVADAEEGESIMGILPYEQENDNLLCRAFYMGPYLKAIDDEDYVGQLERAPFETSQPVTYMWLYRPTGEWKEVEG